MVIHRRASASLCECSLCVYNINNPNQMQMNVVKKALTPKALVRSLLWRTHAYKPTVILVFVNFYQQSSNYYSCSCHVALSVSVLALWNLHLWFSFAWVNFGNVVIHLFQKKKKKSQNRPHIMYAYVLACVPAYTYWSEPIARNQWQNTWTWMLLYNKCEMKHYPRVVSMERA